MTRPPYFGRSGRLLLAVVGQLLGWSLLASGLQAQSVTANEDDLRAAMVSHLPLFVEWPPEKTDPAHPMFRVCVLGADALAPVLEAAFHNAATLPAPVVFRRVKSSDKLDACHLLYIGAAAHGIFARLAPALRQASVLTVSEQPIDGVAGEVIGLPLADNHVRIEVDLVAAQNSKLNVSSKLLRLAAFVRQH